MGQVDPDLAQFLAAGRVGSASSCTLSESSESRRGSSGLRALDPALAAADHVVVVEEELAALEVAADPTQRRESTAARAGRHREPEVQAELGVVLPSPVDEPGDEIRLRWPGPAAVELRRVRVLGRVPLDPSPRDGVVHRSRDDGVNPPHRAGAHRLAPVRSAARRAAVVATVDQRALLHPVLDKRTPVAQGAAAAQVGVQPVEDVDAVLQLPQRHVAERRLQRAPDVALVRLTRRELVVGDLHPAVKVCERRGLIGHAFGLDLRDEPGLRLLGCSAGRVRLLDVGLAARDRVLAGVDDRAEATLEGLDVPGRHGRKVARDHDGFQGEFHGPRSGTGSYRSITVKTCSFAGAALGSRTPDLRITSASL